MARMQLTMKHKANRQGVDDFEGAHMALRSERVIAITADVRGTVMRIEGPEPDFVVDDGIADVVSKSAGALIELTPLGFATDKGRVDHSRRGTAIAVNPDHIKYMPHRRGAVISIEGVERQIIVKQSVAAITKLING